jgi:hypothetical protein
MIQQTTGPDPLVEATLYRSWKAVHGDESDAMGPPAPADTIYPESAFDPLQIDGDPPTTSLVWLAAVGLVLYLIVR